MTFITSLFCEHFELPPSSKQFWIYIHTNIEIVFGNLRVSTLHPLADISLDSIIQAGVQSCNKKEGEKQSFMILKKKEKHKLQSAVSRDRV